MNKEHKTAHSVGSLAALLLFAVFAVCVLSVLLTGAGIYRRLTERDQMAFDSRTAVRYVTTRVRQADRAEGLSLRQFEGLDALVLPEQIDGDCYETWIYCYDGQLRELLIRSGTPAQPEDGGEVLALEELSARWDDAHAGRLLVELETERGREQLTLYLRCGGEVAS